ncbi:MAG: sulfurtransferase [Gammaproteobacteria bacterium]|nr:sulfurtransferase [Gammaproteobacteria bacterium]
MDTTVSAHVPSIDPQALYGLVGTPGAPLVVDVRKQAAFDADPRVVPGAIRRFHDAVEGWAPALDRGRPIVAYCVHGHQISQGVADQLRGLGFDARILAGGVESWNAGGAPPCAPGVFRASRA